MNFNVVQHSVLLFHGYTWTDVRTASALTLSQLSVKALTQG